MISPNIVKVLGDTKFKWTIKLELKGQPNNFHMTFPFEGTYHQAQMTAHKACCNLGSQVDIGKILLERGEECPILQE